MELLSSPEPPMRALGAKSLVYLLLGPEREMGHAKASPLIEVIDPAGSEANESSQGPALSDALQLLLSLLGERESFVYLNALHGLCSLAAHRRHRAAVMDALLRIWEGGNGGEPSTIRRRALVGEGLFLVVRRMQGLCDAALLTRVAVSCLKVVRASHELHLAAAAPGAGASTGEEDPLFLQASALSLLAECAAVGGVAAERYLPDSLDVVAHVLLMPRPSLPAALTAELRRASAFLLFRALVGLGRDVFYLNEGRSVGAAYKAIKVCRASDDAVVRFHGEAAFAQLEALMQEQFPGLRGGGGGGGEGGGGLGIF